VLKHRQHLYLEGRGASFPGKQRTYTKDVASSIVLPLLTTKGLPVGVLSLNSTHSTTKLSEDDIQVLQAMANLVAIAIDDAEVYQALHQKDQQLKAAATDLVKAQEEERKHVAYDLHDGLAQMIAGTYQRLQGLRANTALTPGQAERELDRVQAQLKQSLEEVRRVIADLRPSVLDDFGLETALRQYLAVRQAEADWELDCDISLKEPKLEPYIENTVFRIVQEAATNVLKHAESGRLLVRVTQGREWLDVEVRDWGKGFRPLVTKKPAPGRQVGLEAMADRAALLGGTFKVVSRPGQGTRITVRLPLPGSASEA
jgi:signal transduction histidine kinase